MGLKINVINDTEYDSSYDNNNSVVMGTIEGNSFLKNNRKSIPFSIATEKISIGKKEVKGNNLKFISVCTSPKNDRRGMFVLSGQSVEDVKDIWNSQDINVGSLIGYLVIKDNKILDKGRF